ncbi:hypothetical protein CLV51_1011217 [Chitinophaga niastensis]|uniref:Uncharacterized protein n=1 Tax=Chitinophaga niastensis TaxID=536980 RepID=A0A2P8HUH3_CHINA|nr:hypothetical protein CLV51_1011217 [Chitinophaga niastensis]
MFSDKTRQKLIYRTLRFLLFIISIPISMVALTYSPGSEIDAFIWREQHPRMYVFICLAITVLLMSFFSALLFMIGKVCKVEAQRMTYVWLTFIPLCMLLLILLNMAYRA